jgi:hypothetical protein
MRAVPTAPISRRPASSAADASAAPPVPRTSDIPASHSSHAAVNTRLNECGSDESALAGAIGGRPSGWR